MLLKHSLIYVFSRGLPGLISLLSVYIYSRLVSPSAYGDFSYVMAIIALFNVVGYQWIKLSVLRFCNGFLSSNQKNSFLYTVLISHIVVSIVMIALFLLYIFIKRDSSAVYLIGLGCAILIVQALYEIFLEITRSMLKPVSYGITLITKSVITLILSVVLLWYGLGVYGLFIGVFVGYCLPTLIIVLKASNQLKGCKFDKDIYKTMYRYGFPLTLSLVFAYVVNFSDRLILNKMCGNEITGLYSMNYDFSATVIGLFFAIINTASYPITVKILETSGIKAASTSLMNGCGLIMLLVLPVCAGMMLLTENISYVFLGEQYRVAGAELIPIIALSSVIAGFKHFHFDLAFQLSGKTSGQVKIMFVCAIFNVIVTILLVFLMGYVGAAYATLLSYFLASLMSWYYGRNLFPVRFPIYWKRVLVAVFIMSVCLAFFTDERGSDWLIIQIVSGFIVYATSLYLFDVAGLRSRINQIVT